MADSDKRRKQRIGLFLKQKGKCHWCQCEMLLAYGHLKKQPANLATIDHLDDRFSPERGKHYGEYRRVLACAQCNFDRGKSSQAAQPIEVLRNRSQQHRARA